MTFTLNQPLIAANQQTFKVCAISCIKNNKGEWIAQVRFEVTNENGKKVAEQSIQYKPAEFNDFYTSWNNTNFLYQELADKLDVQFPVNTDFTPDTTNPSV